MFLSKRGQVYYIWYTDDLGRKKKISTSCRLKSEALKFLRDFEQSLVERHSRGQRVLLSRFIDEFLEYSAGAHRPKTTDLYFTALSEFYRVAGDMPLHKLGVREIETFLASKAKGVSASTLRTYFVHLSAAFGTAVRWSYLSKNPFCHVPKPKLGEKLPLFFSRDEFDQLMRSIPNLDHREIVFCAVSTGMRLGENLALRWSDVDISSRVITVQNSRDFNTKNNKARGIPMTEGLYRMLLQRQERLSSEAEVVFHRNGQNLKVDKVSKLFKRAVRIAGLNDKLHFH